MIYILHKFLQSSIYICVSVSKDRTFSQFSQDPSRSATSEGSITSDPWQIFGRNLTERIKRNSNQKRHVIIARNLLFSLKDLN